jgi:hypothetical protein
MACTPASAVPAAAPSDSLTDSPSDALTDAHTDTRRVEFDQRHDTHLRALAPEDLRPGMSPGHPAQLVGVYVFSLPRASC